ncbi:bifunctional diguanylate cyclase/phosphodiesterase [Sphingomonas hankookensis]|uniref:Diguanylate cyclase n=1 Tax=Sphingomonas hankookensis TaxID=563996 RepID=A0ABR5YC97_9SPHN|nr:EAL domain-containing protein [Sphingomonas hankookensis]KZE12048.1 diguanylate cyclase [Sphingomonas hankookensis]
MRFLTCLTEEHNLALVGLAAWFCLVGSMITIRLLDRIRHAERGTRMAWVFLGGAATGATIWCTHFIAMIAYQPGVEVAYEPRLTGISLLLAIFGSAGALHLTTRRWHPSAALGGALFGLTVSVMHYVGMQAFVARGMVRWSHGYVALSVLFAVALGALAFDRARATGRFAGPWWATGLMVASIVLLHFTGMAAMIVTPFSPAIGQVGSSTATIVMAIAVAGVGTLVVGTGLATYILDAQARADTRRRLRELLESNVDGMVIVQGGKVLAVNAALTALVGGDAAVIGQPLARWIPDIATADPDRIAQLSLTAHDGTDIPVEIAVRFDQRRACPQTIYSIRDLRARIAQERRIAHLARNDSLTGLPNRTSFLEWLARQTGPDSTHRAVALLSIDLDRFKEVNDMHGHAAGDQLLTRIGERMKAALLPGEFIARLGGDEFVAVMPVTEPDDAAQLIDRLRDAITAPVMIEHSGIEASCGMSLGVALWPRDATELSTLINNADLAMYRAKASIATDACFYEEEMDKTVRLRRRMVKELRTAIDRGEFSLHWQVQESVGTGAITGYEALLRWTRADGSSVSPANFIPLAEQSGLILAIGEWVLRTACATAASWAEPHRIAVNLSPVQLGHVDLPRLVQQVLLDTGLSPARLELEITETAMIADPVRTIHILRQLKAIGVSVAMDDFGTGYSSLSTLRSFPFDKIKLDRSFMAELNGAPQSAAIVRAVLTLGESLDIPVLAEGVETPEQLAFLREQGCDEAQGYLLGRPGPLPVRGRDGPERLAG